MICHYALIELLVINSSRELALGQQEPLREFELCFDDVVSFDPNGNVPLYF